MEANDDLLEDLHNQDLEEEFYEIVEMFYDEMWDFTASRTQQDQDQESQDAMMMDDEEENEEDVINWIEKEYLGGLCSKLKHQMLLFKVRGNKEEKNAVYGLEKELNTWYLLSSLRENLEYNQDDHEWIGDDFIQKTSHVSSNAPTSQEIINKKAAQIRKFREDELYLQDEEELFQHVQRCKEYRLYSSVQDWLGKYILAGYFDFLSFTF